MKRPKSILWITDPWHTLDHARDTSLRLAQEGVELGIPQFWCDVKTLRLDTTSKKIVQLEAQAILSVSKDRAGDSFELGPVETRQPRDFSILQYRTDPPVDLAYIHPLHLLHVGLRGVKTTEVVNPIEVLLCLNEKTESAALAGLMPPSLVSSQWEPLLKFGRAQGRTVLKPLHEAQSHGIELLDWRTGDVTENARQKLEIATQRFTTPIILQRYLEGIAHGEVRLWFLDGKLLACAKKLPVSGDFRVDMDRGSQLSLHVLTRMEKAKVLRISKHLRARKIRLAAVDLIEGWITDFNFTSPGLITQMESLLDKNLSRAIIKALV
jgi:glutathione synthase